jgi:hypothetical protein
VSVIASKGVASWTHPAMIIGTVLSRPLRNSSMALGTQDRLSVAIARQSRSSDGALLMGACASIRPKEEVRTASSSSNQTCVCGGGPPGPAKSCNLGRAALS